MCRHELEVDAEAQAALHQQQQQQQQRQQQELAGAFGVGQEGGAVPGAQAIAGDHSGRLSHDLQEGLAPSCVF